MEITYMVGDQIRHASSERFFPLQLPRDQLFVGWNIASRHKKAHTPSGNGCFELQECGLDLTCDFPEWLIRPQSRSSRSRSHARYIGEGNVVLRGMNLGILLQVLPAGRETSCHYHPPVESHPGTKEYFLPLATEGEKTPEFYLSTDKMKVPMEGYHVGIGQPHQLRAPDDVTTVTMIFMWPIPHATWMKGHVEHGCIFVPYT